MPRPPAGRLLLPAALAAALLGTGPAAAFAQDDAGTAPNPLLVEPEGTVELVEAAARLRRIGRPNLAKRYLKALLDSNPDVATLLDARDAVGPATFFELATDPALRPEGATLQQRIDEAFARRSADPARLDALIDALAGGARDRAAAEATLRSLADAAAPRLVERLVRSVAPASGENALTASIARVLGLIGEKSVAPLKAVLRDPAAPPAARGAVAVALGRTGTTDALLPLFGPAFDAGEAPSVRQSAIAAVAELLGVSPTRVERVAKSDAAVRLSERSDALLAEPLRVTGLGPNDAAAPALFRYDAAENRLIPATVSAGVAGRYEAAALASDAARLAPSREDLRAKELSAALAYEAALAGRGVFVPTGPGSVHRAALSAGTGRVSEALDSALDLGAEDAAAGALQVLLTSPGPELLGPLRGGTSPVVRALSSPAPEVRFLAALLAARSNPDERFTEGGRVVEIFAAALNDTPGGRALVIDPNGERATRMAGVLQSLGFRVSLAQRGRAGFEQAVAGQGADLVAVHANVPDVPVSQFAANLRADARTRATPLVIYGDARLAGPVGRLADRTGDATFVDYPTAPEILARRIADLGGRSPLPDALKDEQKVAAAAALADLAAADDGTFPLREAEPALAAAVTDPAVAADAAAALGAIAEPQAQESLASALLVTRPGGGGTTAAARALTASLRRFGSLLDAAVVARLRELPGTADDERLRDEFLTLAAALPGGADVLPVQVTLPAE